MGKIIIRTYVYIHELSLKEIKSYEQLFLTAVPGFVRAFCLPSDKTIYTKKSVCVYIRAVYELSLKEIKSYIRDRKVIFTYDNNDQI